MPDSNIDTTVQTLRQMRAQMEHDMAMISRRDFSGLGDRHRQKLAAAGAMREELARLLEQVCAGVERHALPDLGALKDTLADLIALAERHQRQILGAMAASQARIQTVIDARLSAYGAHETYGPRADRRRGYFHRHAVNMRNTDA